MTKNIKYYRKWGWILQKLPGIYKSTVNVQNNLKTFYSKNQEPVTESLETLEKAKVYKSVEESIAEIFKNKNYSYAKRLMVTTQGKTYETRFISENNDQILTIDNEILEKSKIDAIRILD